MNTLGGVVLICLGIFTMTLVVIGRGGAVWAAITGTPQASPYATNGLGSALSGSGLNESFGSYANVDPSATAAAAGLTAGAGGNGVQNPAVPTTGGGFDSNFRTISATQAIARRATAYGIA